MVPAGRVSGSQPVGPSYAGSLTDTHIRAVARLALRAAGVQPDVGKLAGAVREERLLAQRLVEVDVPERLPALATAVEKQAAEGRPAVTERLPGMLALGWRQVHILRSPASPHRTVADMGLLGATFNAAIATYDTLVDEPDPRRPNPPDAVEGFTGLVAAVLRDPSGARRSDGPGGDADWSLLTALVQGWAQVATTVLERGDAAAWPAVAETVASLLAAETRLVAARMPGPQTAALSRWVSVGPAEALGLMARLDSPPTDPEEGSCAAAHLGEVMWLADDLADLATDARRGHPNTLLDGCTGTLTDPDLYGRVAIGAERLATCLHRPMPRALHGFAAEIAFRWLQWDQHPPPPTASRAASGPADAALEFLLRRRADQFAGDEHRLTFPRENAHGVGLEVHDGLVFLRATVLDALLDAHDAGITVPDGVLAAEGVTLLQAKHPLARGGWSYLPGVPELPPDADDLAQVLRALHHLGGRSLAMTCNEGVRLALDAAGPSTEVPTWILPATARNDVNRKMLRCVELVGGGGSHLDVVANLLLALAETDPVRYAEPLFRGAQRLASRQTPDGGWPSAWYAGPYHATALAVSVLRMVGGFNDVLQRARTFLLERQNSAGGWVHEGGEAVPTAQALLALCRLDATEDVDARHRAVRRLRDLELPDGGWPADPWIRFPTRDGTHTYGSATATTAVVLKALLAARRTAVRDRHDRRC
jgi:hypothetical protein